MKKNREKNFRSILLIVGFESVHDTTVFGGLNIGPQISLNKLTFMKIVLNWFPRL